MTRHSDRMPSRGHPSGAESLERLEPPRLSAGRTAGRRQLRRNASFDRLSDLFAAVPYLNMHYSDFAGSIATRPSIDRFKSETCNHLKLLVESGLNRWIGRPIGGRHENRMLATNYGGIWIKGWDRPANRASRTQCTFSKLLIFLVATGASVSFCSRSFHPIRCGFVAAFSWSRMVAAAPACLGRKPFGRTVYR